MNEAVNHIPNLLTLISAAVAPVVLISAVAIFFSGMTNKHGHLSDQVRQLTAEYRQPATSQVRRGAIRQQLIVFERRLTALVIANGLLSLALLSFAMTVLFVIWSQRTERIGVFGIFSLLMGLLFFMLAVVAEMYEIGRGRATLRYEVKDIDGAPIDVSSAIEMPPGVTAAPGDRR